MNLLTYDQREAAVLERYRSLATQGNAYMLDQVVKILDILSDIDTMNWQQQLSETWTQLMQSMQHWSAAWDRRLQSQAIKQEPWTAQFITYTTALHDSVQTFERRLRRLIHDQQTKGRTRGRLAYTDMQLAYLRLLQHVHDVPTIDDAQHMHYQPPDDPSGIQAMLQQDEAFTRLLRAAGAAVLWAQDDMLAPTHAELPPLFDEMLDLYAHIEHELRGSPPATPETQEMPAGLPHHHQHHEDHEDHHHHQDHQPHQPHQPHQQQSAALAPTATSTTRLLRQLQRVCLHDSADLSHS